MLRMFIPRAAAFQRRWLPLVPLLAAVSIAGCRRESASPPAESLPVVAVRVQIIQPQRHLAVEEVVGTVRARLRATVEAKVSGRIEQMLVKQGQSVSAGELLTQLDAREMQARLDSARAVREQAEAELKRARSLLDNAATSRAEFDAVQARQRVAEAMVKEMETMLGRALLRHEWYDTLQLFARKPQG